MYKNYMYSDSFPELNKLGKALARLGYKVRMKRVPKGHCLEANASTKTINKVKDMIF